MSADLLTPAMAGILDGVRRVNRPPFYAMTVAEARLAYVAATDKLRAAQVPVALEILRGVTHDFIKMGRVLDEASAPQALAAEALQKAFAA